MRKTSMALALVLVTAISASAFGLRRRTSIAEVYKNREVATSHFCTIDGDITVRHHCIGEDSRNSCRFGVTLLTGPSTQRLGSGRFSIPAGCYHHALVDTVAFGDATARSIVWYESGD
jgi:hypothetical protein